jgi:rSAM/selenodomain-associated transferase 2
LRSKWAKVSAPLNRLTLSVVIPAHNESREICHVVRAVTKQMPYEVIVAAGSSTDGTADIARQEGVRVSVGAKGRAAQMNEGARLATGEALVFLHCDTFLPPDGLRQIQHALDNPVNVGGRFRVSFDCEGFGYRLLAFYTRFPFFSYGDQVFFVRRSVFRALRGFDCNVPFEDVDFYRRMRRYGRDQILKSSVVTSARRFRKAGFFRQKIMNLLLSTLVTFKFPVKPLLKKLYPDVR